MARKSRIRPGLTYKEAKEIKRIIKSRDRKARVRIRPVGWLHPTKGFRNGKGWRVQIKTNRYNAHHQPIWATVV